jgi:4-amino-4-deoxy-L-arabinose transferase-like glycosyltransferase
VIWAQLESRVARVQEPAREHVSPTAATGVAAPANQSWSRRPRIRYGVLTLVGLILLVGLSLRIANLDGPDLNVDEVLHVFAAENLLAGNGPTLPSGRPYRRAMLYTDVVAIAGRFGGVNEWTARVPSVIFGTLTIGLVFMMGRTWYSDATGLVAAFITALAPMQVAFSREARMYAMFEFCFLLGVFAFYLGFETAPKRTATSRVPDPIRKWCAAAEIWPLMLLLAAAALVLARYLHDLTLIALIGPAAYVVAMALVAFGHSGLRLSRDKYIVSMAVLVVAGLSYGYARRVWEYYSWTFSYTPEWAVLNTGIGYYAQALSNEYGLIFHTLLLASAVALRRNTKATLFLLACFGVPVALQTVFFPWKHQRYILHLIPLMLVLFSAGAVPVVGLAYRSLERWARGTAGRSAARLVAIVLTAGAILFGLWFMPWFRQGLLVHRHTQGTVAGVYHHQWQTAASRVSNLAAPSDVVIASAPALARYYGVSQRLYYLANDSTAMHLEAGARDAEGRPIEYIAGAPMILDVEMLDRVVTGHQSGWIVTERFRFEGTRPLPPDIREYIQDHCQQEELADAPTMVMWRWGGSR